MSQLLLLLLACETPDAPPSASQTCAEGEVSDGKECVPEACGTGKWGGADQAGADMFVDAQADASGDGSIDHPFTTIQAGADAADGGRVAVAAGTYVENLALIKDHDGLVIAGRCAERVTIDGGQADEPALILSGKVGTSVQVSGMTILGGTLGAGTQGGRLSLTDAIVRDSDFLGVFAYGGGATLALDRVTVTGTRVYDRGVGGYGMQVDGAGAATVTDSTFTDCAVGAVVVNSGEVTVTNSRITATRGTGVYADGAGADVTLVDVSIDDIRADDINKLAFGVDAVGGASVRMERTSIRSTDKTGVFVASGASIIALDSTIDQSGGSGIVAKDGGTTLSWSGGHVRKSAGMGVQVQEGAGVDLSTTVISDCSGYCVYAISPETSIQMAGVTIARATASDDGSDGIGVYLVDGAGLQADGLASSDNAASGLAVIDGSASVRNLLLTGNGGPDAAFDVALSVDDGGTLDVAGAIIADNEGVGIQAAGTGTRLTLVDSLVTRTTPDSEGAYGVALIVGDGARAEVSRSSFADNAQHGLEAVDGVVTVWDSEFVRNGGAGLLLGGSEDSELEAYTELNGSVVSDNLGYGAQTFAATLVARDSEFVGNTGVGLLVGGLRARLVLEGVRVGEVSAYRQEDRWSEGAEGRGIVIQGGSSAEIRDVVLDGCVGVGLLATDADVEISGLAIRGVRRSPYKTVGAGVIAQSQASVHATGLTVEGTEGPGLMVTTDGWLGCDDCTLDNNAFAGIVLWDGSAEISNSTIVNTAADANQGGGIGIYAATDTRHVGLRLTDSTIGPHRYAGLWLNGNGTYDIEGNTMYAGASVDLNGWPAHGNAVYAFNGVTAWNPDTETGLLLANNAIMDADQTAILLHDATATLNANNWAGNTMDVRQQHCVAAASLTDADLRDVPAADICESADSLIDTSVEFALFLSEAAPIQ